MTVNETRLRREAQAFKLNKLCKSQKEAVKCILEKLQAAHGEIKKEKGPKNPPQWTFPVPDENKNRVLLLSGGRGSGKTSVLFSVVKLLEKFDEKIDSDEEEIIKLCEDLQRKLIWLQPLEMEILPPSSNLLAAILNRVDEAVARFRGYHPTTHQDPRLGPEDQDELLEFTRLQQDVALAWNGNLEKHAVNIDPDAYAIEVLRAEQYRLDLNGRIEHSLDQLHKIFIKPSNPNVDECLFVLPVDDFDINPHRCLELIQLIRMLNVPRLFILILGDIRVISHLLNLKFIESIATLESRGGLHFNNTPSYDECRLSHELSANAIRKLFAKSNQVSLRPIEAKYVLAFNGSFNGKKENKDEDSIEDYLKKYQGIILNTGFREPKKGSKDDTYTIANKSINSLYDFLFNIEIEKLIKIEKLDVSETSDVNDSEKKPFYIKESFYTMYPRHVQDLYLWLRMDCNKPESSNPDYFKFAEKLYKEKIREGKDLTSRMSEFLSRILIKDLKGSYQLDTSSLNLVYSYSQPIVMERYHEKSYIGMRRPKNWYLEVNYSEINAENPGMPNKIRLNEFTASGIILMHDLLAFKNPRQIIGNRLLPKTASQWAYTQWPFGNDFQSIQVPWYFPPWMTMFECDLLRRCWIVMWDWISELKMKIDAKKNVDSIIELLSYAWLNIITDIILNDNDGIILQSLDEENCVINAIINKTIGKRGWEILNKKISTLGKFETNQHERRRFIIRGWLVAIGCFLAPETGLFKKHLKLKIIFEKLKKRLTTPIIASGIRKLRAQSAVLFFDSGALPLLIELFHPQMKKEMITREYNKNTDLSINTIGGKILCPYFEDIIMLSKQTPQIKRQFASDLIKLINRNSVLMP